MTTAFTPTFTTHPARPVRAALSGDMRIARAVGWVVTALLVVFIVCPLVAILAQAVLDHDGHFDRFAQARAILSDPRLIDSIAHSAYMALATTALVIPLAFTFAFALCRTRIWARGPLKLLALAPMLAPSLLPAISLVYLFGNQGPLKGWLGSYSLYGPIGIVLGEAFYTFPHALLVILSALTLADARLYEAAETLGASRLRRLLTITLPQAKYGLVSAALLVFTLTITDFCVPVVVGGQYNVLALEAYKQVIGQQHFGEGAVVGLMLLIPAVFAVVVERMLARSQAGALSGRSAIYVAKPNRLRDVLLWCTCVLISLCLLALLGTAVVASFIKLWPYSMEFSLMHYDFDMVDGGGWLAFRNSIKLASYTAVIGCGMLFLTTYLLEKTPLPSVANRIIRAVAMLPMAVPGLVLGLGYIFFFNATRNPLHGLYGTLAILVISTVAHYFSTGYMTLSTSLRQLDGEIEAVSATLKRPWWHSCLHITLPVCLPTILDVGRFMFVSAMSTVSCTIFLYTPDTVLAGVAVLNMDDAGDTAAAAAMATLIVATSFAATLVLNAIGWLLNRRAQRWRTSRT